MSAPLQPFPCSGCGALNDPHFDRCVRCNQPLAAAKKQPASARQQPAAPGPRRRAHAARNTGIFKHFTAEQLPATKLLVGITLLIFGGQAISTLQRGEFRNLLLGGNPIDTLRFGAIGLHLVRPPHPLNITPELLLIEEPWRLLSAVFVHFGIIHFVLNMSALVWLARLTEPAIGSARFTIAYVLTGIIGFACTVLYVDVIPQPMHTAGASGAVFGIMGVILGFLFRRRDPRWKNWAMQGVFYSVLFGFMMHGVNNSAHLGGLASGTVLGALFAPGAPAPAKAWQDLAASLCVAACIASLALAQLSPLPKRFEDALGRAPRGGSQTTDAAYPRKATHRNIHQQGNCDKHGNHTRPPV